MNRQAEHRSAVVCHTVTTDTIRSVIAELKTMIHKEIDDADELIAEEDSTASQNSLQHLEGYLLGLSIMGHKIIHYIQRKLLY